MMLKEYYDLLPTVVADNMGGINKAEQFAADLVANAPDDPWLEDQNVVTMVATRKEAIERMTGNLANAIHQLALAMHANEGFE